MVGMGLAGRAMMSLSDENIRHICGNTMLRRFAYVHKKDNQKFGLLEATGKANAREYLGRDFMIKETWLSMASSEFERKVQRILRIVHDEGRVITQREFSRRTQWLPAKERNDIVTQLKDAGSLFDGVRNTKGREAHSLGLSIADLELQGWTIITAEMVQSAIAEKKATDEEMMTVANREVKRDIVSSLFPGMVGPSEECNASDDYLRLLKENKELRQQLEDLMLASRVEIVELKRKPKKPEKKHPIKVSTDQIEIEKLKAFACSYSNCLWSHCMSEESNARDTNMLFNHAQYVARNADECWQFLKARGVKEVGWKYCQYFFAICWPIHKPWMELSRYVLSKLLEDGTLKNSDIPGNPFMDTRPLFAASSS